MSTTAKPSKISIILAYAAVYVIWGSTYLGIKYAIQTIPPLLMSGVRYFIAGLLVYLIAKATGAPNKRGRFLKLAMLVQFQRD